MMEKEVDGEADGEAKLTLYNIFWILSPALLS